MRTYVIDLARGLTAAGVLMSAVVHYDLYQQGFSAVDVIGPLFLLNFIGGVVIGTGIVVWRHWLPVFLGAGFGATTVVFYWISVVHGLFGIKEFTTGWPELTAEFAEYAAVLFGMLAAVLLWLDSRARATTSNFTRSSGGPEPRNNRHASVPVVFHQPR